MYSVVTMYLVNYSQGIEKDVDYSLSLPSDILNASRVCKKFCLSSSLILLVIVSWCVLRSCTNFTSFSHEVWAVRPPTAYKLRYLNLMNIFRFSSFLSDMGLAFYFWRLVVKIPDSWNIKYAVVTSWVYALSLPVIVHTSWKCVILLKTESNFVAG